MAEVCPHCGTREVDWIDPATGRPWDPPRWMAVPLRDYGCEAIETAQREWPDEQSRDGLRFVARPYDPEWDRFAAMERDEDGGTPWA